jgi:hypothetical protein
MAGSLAVARACIESNQRLLLATRHRLEVSHRLLYHSRVSIAGGSGDPDVESALRTTVRRLLASGALWPIDGSVQWASYGSGNACYVCGRPIAPSQIEYEVDDGGLQRPACHFARFVAWHEESA